MEKPAIFLFIHHIGSSCKNWFSIKQEERGNKLCLMQILCYKGTEEGSFLYSKHGTRINFRARIHSLVFLLAILVQLSPHYKSFKNYLEPMVSIEETMCYDTDVESLWHRFGLKGCFLVSRRSTHVLVFVMSDDVNCPRKQKEVSIGAQLTFPFLVIQEHQPTSWCHQHFR